MSCPTCGGDHGAANCPTTELQAINARLREIRDLLHEIRDNTAPVGVRVIPGPSRPAGNHMCQYDTGDTCVICGERGP